LSVMYLNGTSKTRFEMKSMDLGLFGLKGTWKPCSWSISFKKNQEIFFPRT
jgi:phage antirepressor YoqD-like protein